METAFLIYGANGFVGKSITNLAVAQGLSPILGGRNEDSLKGMASDLGLEYQVIDLADSHQLDQVLSKVTLVLNCAGPFIYTYRPMVEACMRTGTHYLDITGEPPVFQAIADLDQEAVSNNVMLMPGVGFDVVPTDCLAVYLKNRLPSANRLTIAFQAIGPAGMPPGTQKTMIEMIPLGNLIRREGALVPPKQVIKTRQIDLGNGMVTATRITWGDVFTAWYSTGIPNIEDYLVIPLKLHGKLKRLNRWRPLFKLPFVRNYLKSKVKPGSNTHTQSQTQTLVWGEVTDDQGGKAVARLRGPEAGVVWTGLAALVVVKKVLKGVHQTGFQTPGKVYGPDLVMECKGVSREDVFD